MTRATNSTSDRVLTLLGNGVSPEQVASALGITVSRVSQLLSDPEFTSKVAELRFSALQKHNSRDELYDSIEDALLEKLGDCLCFITKPFELLKAIQVINAAKRRGSSAPDQVLASQTIVNITIPSMAATKFVTNPQNQVVRAGSQELLTIQSGSLMKRVQNEQSETTRLSAPKTSIPATITVEQRESKQYSTLDFVSVGG